VQSVRRTWYEIIELSRHDERIIKNVVVSMKQHDVRSMIDDDTSLSAAVKINSSQDITRQGTRSCINPSPVRYGTEQINFPALEGDPPNCSVLR